MSPGLSKGALIGLVGGMIATGAANTLVYKAQNSYFTSESNSLFSHTFIQATMMFMGETICIIPFLIYRNRHREDYEKEKAVAAAKGLGKLNYFMLFIPAAADFFTSNMQYIALKYIAPSLYQMLRGGVILVIAAFSVIFLKRKLQPHNYIGCALVMVGIGFVGMAKYIFPEDGSSSSNADSDMQVISIILVLIALFTNGVHYISEEKVFMVSYVHPFQMVGIEGLWGLLIYAVALPLLVLLPCPSSFGKLCQQYNGESQFENPGLYFRQIWGNGLLFFYVVLGVCTIAMFNVCGVTVTKHLSSLTRSLIDVVRTIIIWGVSIVVTETYGENNPNFSWETIEYKQMIIEVLGFVIFVVGNLVYNKILILPFAVPKEETKANKAELLSNSDVSEKLTDKYEIQ